MAEESVESRQEKARNSASSEELKKLSQDEDSYVRSLVSNNSNTPSSVLELMVKDDDYSVRYGIAQNENTPFPVLEELANDNEYLVRNGVAENNNTPVLLLEKLAEDPEESVRRRVLENENTPDSVLKKMGASEDSTSDDLSTENNIYEISMVRIGGEVVVGSITKEQYDYWHNKSDEEISQHFLEDDIEESEVPSDAWIGNRWFEMDNVEHLNGCELSIANKIEVWFDGNERSCIFECDLDEGMLKKKGVKISLDTVNFKDFEKGYYFLYHPIEKGGLKIDINSEGDFDPKKLTLVGTELVMPKNKGIYISSLDYEGGNVIEGDGFGEGDFTDTHWVEFFKV